MVSFILLHFTHQPTMETMRRPSAFTRSSIRYYQQRHTRIKYPPQARPIRSILVKTTISSPTLLPDSNLYNASTNALSCTTLPLLFMCSLELKELSFFLTFIILHALFNTSMCVDSENLCMRSPAFLKKVRTPSKKWAICSKNRYLDTWFSDVHQSLTTETS